jgi:hypothetical protein
MNLQEKEEIYKKYEKLLQLKKQQLYKQNSKHETAEKTNIRNSLQNIYDYLAKQNLGENDLIKITKEIASLQ